MQYIQGELSEICRAKCLCLILVKVYWVLFVGYYGKIYPYYIYEKNRGRGGGCHGDFFSFFFCYKRDDAEP